MSGRILGAVLAGGRSSRFGSDKAAAVLDGRALIDHALARLAPQVDGLVVVGRAYTGYDSVADRPRPGLGPLGGVCAALDHAVREGYVAVVTAACDIPYLPDDLVACLAGIGPAMLADCPVIGWWPATLARLLDAHLEQASSGSVARWARDVGAREILLDRPLPNVNTPADLQQLTASNRACPPHLFTDMACCPPTPVAHGRAAT